MTRSEYILLLATILTGAICTGIIALNFIYVHKTLTHIADLIAKPH